MTPQISVLCVAPKSNYFDIPGLDLWTEERDAYKFTGSNPVITHAPCQQWSRMKAFARSDAREKELAMFCLDQVRRNGGIFEHPHGSSFFKYAGIRPTYCVDQFWWGFPARKRTWLYFYECSALSHPLSFDAIQYCVGGNRGRSALPEMKRMQRSIMPLAFCQYLVDSLNETYGTSPTETVDSCNA